MYLVAKSTVWSFTMKFFAFIRVVLSSAGVFFCCNAHCKKMYAQDKITYHNQITRRSPMSRLYFPDNKQEITDYAQIQVFLKERGVQFERWELPEELAEDADQQEIGRASCRERE